MKQNWHSPIHEPVAIGNAAVRKEETDLVEGLRHQGDKVPERVRVL